MKQITMPEAQGKDGSPPIYRGGPIYRGRLTTRKSAFTGDTTGYNTEHRSSMLYYVSKRMMDIVLAAAGMVVLLPVFLVIAMCITLDDRGPILHFRELVGLRERRFFALKFRTMIPDADAYLEKHPGLMREYQKSMKLKDDPRVTRVGKFLRKTSLDELPQLFNVLTGEMSLVGPRGIHASELVRYGKYAQKRLAVKPGITGLWQVSNRQHNSYEERIPYDIAYIDNRSFLLDLLILVKTLKVFIVPTGI